MKIYHLHPEHPTETVIQIEELHRSVTLMHITDSHLNLADDRDPEALELIKGERRSAQSRMNASLRHLPEAMNWMLTQRS